MPPPLSPLNRRVVLILRVYYYYYTVIASGTADRRPNRDLNVPCRDQIRDW